MHTHPSLEILESRIAPATLLPGSRSVTYFDADGDKVTVSISKGTFEDPNAFGQTDFVFSSLGNGAQQLQVLNLANKTEFDGANISITAIPFFDQTGVDGGDGAASVGYINATGIDLGIVNVRGDLGAIDAGNANPLTSGLKSLTVLSLGGEDTLTGAPDLLSDIVGPVGSIKVTGDISEATIAITGGISGTLGSLTVGGSIIGGFGTNSGEIIASGAVGTVKIGGDLLGGSGTSSGVIQGLKLGTVTIGGAISGGSGGFSGQVFADLVLSKITVGGALIGAGGGSSGLISAESIGYLNIDGSVFGGTGLESGKIVTGGNITSLRISGSLNGGGNSDSGFISVGGTLGTATILGNIFGGDSGGANQLDNSGYIEADRITTLTIGGSIIAGTDGGGGLTNSGAIRSQNDIGTLTVKGSLEGNATNPVIITAVGQVIASGTTDIAMRNVNVLGRVFNAEILAGYSPDLSNSFFGEPVNADAQIVNVKVGGDWIASDLIAGVDSGTDSFFGDFNDTAMAGSGVTDRAAVVSKISSIIIGGRALGTASSGDAIRFGFGAQHIVSMKVGGVTPLQLFAGRGTDTFTALSTYPLGTTQGTFGDGFDVHVYEVA